MQGNFSNPLLDKIREKITLSGWIGTSVRLKKRGYSASGLCPFHQEKSPSFTVEDAKGFYHCFGCGAHGDIFDFVMKTDRLTFPEAVEKLALAAGVTLERSENTPRKANDRLYQCLEAAHKLFQSQLQSLEGAAATAYLLKRGLTPQVILESELGWSRQERNFLGTRLIKDGFALETLVACGLVGYSEDKSTFYDRFRGRLMFPIQDRQGRTIAFGGRVIDAQLPKYLNSPETPLFHKGSTLYNLHRARHKVSAQMPLVLVEGYMDVVSLAQYGMDAVVAPLGTAITPMQVEAVWQASQNPIIMLDGDAAGIKAAARLAETVLPILKPGYSVRFATLPPQQDPDSLVRNQGLSAIHAILAQSQPLDGYLWRVLHLEKPRDTPESWADLKQNIAAHVSLIHDPEIRATYARSLRQKYEDAIAEYYRVAAKPSTRSSPGKPIGAQRTNTFEAPRLLRKSLVSLDARSLQQKILLATCLLHPYIINEVAEDLAFLDFAEARWMSFFRALVACATEDSGVSHSISSQALQDTLKRTGWAGEVNELISPILKMHMGFAQEAANSNEIIKGWHHIYKLCQGKNANAKF